MQADDYQITYMREYALSPDAGGRIYTHKWPQLTTSYHRGGPIRKRAVFQCSMSELSTTWVGSRRERATRCIG